MRDLLKTNTTLFACSFYDTPTQPVLSKECFPYLNQAISQNLKVSFSHQDVTFYVVGVLAKALRVKEVYSNSWGRIQNRRLGIFNSAL